MIFLNKGDLLVYKLNFYGKLTSTIFNDNSR